MGQIMIDGTRYEVEVRRGVRYIDGKTLDEFMASLPLDTLVRLAKVGQQAMVDKMRGTYAADNGYQEQLSELEFKEY